MPVTDLHPLAALCTPKWERVSDAVEGADAIKAKGRLYLPKLPGQRVIARDGVAVDEYQNYLARAVWLPYSSRTLAGLVGMVFRKAPTLRLPAAAAPHLRNLTLSGVSAEGFAKRVLSENLTTGFGGILVDWSDFHQRPFVRLYGARAVRNWRVDTTFGFPVLTQLVLYEEVDEAEPGQFGARVTPQYRVVALDRGDDAAEPQPGAPYPFGRLTHQVWRRLEGGAGGGDDWAPVGEPLVPLRRGQPLSFIPFVPFHPHGTTMEPGKPPLLDLVDVNLAHYRNAADYENLLHYACVPTLLLAGISTKQDIHLGSTRAIVTEKTGADGKYIQTGGQGGAEIRQAMEDKKHDMAVVGARLLLSERKRAAESAEALELQFAGDDATLQNVVGSTAMALEQALVWHVWWFTGAATLAQAEAAVGFDLNTDFLQGIMAMDDAVKLMTLVQGEVMSERTAYFNLERGERTRPGVTFEQEQAEIAGDRARRAALTPSGVDLADPLAP